VLRAFLWASFMKVLCGALAASSDAQLAAVAAKSLKEVRYHQQHSGGWVVRLGDGSVESKRRCEAALLALWPYTREWFEADAVDEQAQASGLGPSWSTLRDAWLGEVRPVLGEATLCPPPDTPFRSTGKQGVHSEHMGLLLAEMQALPRAFPGAVW
jgi:ring-1,2-phenylacetyl-CoA epoxidase subunit PaaC